MTDYARLRKEGVSPVGIRDALEQFGSLKEVKVMHLSRNEGPRDPPVKVSVLFLRGLKPGDACVWTEGC